MARPRTEPEQQPALEVEPEPADVAAELATLRGIVDDVVGNAGAALQALGAIARERDQAIHQAMVASTPRTLDERMAAVQNELEDVARRGHARVQTSTGGTYEYDYITEADLMKAIRPLLAKHGVATYYSDEIVELTNAGVARVKVTLTLAANGESRVLTAEGVGTDKGDKAANKAKTSAVRYLLWKTFLQPSDEDPEEENVSVDEATRAHEARQPRPAQRGGGATRGQLVQRIAQLAVELDEVQGREPGKTLGMLPAAVRDALNVDYPNGVAEPQLVAIGQHVAGFVATERQRVEAEGDGYSPVDLDLSTLKGQGA